jgi:hypothetical protein
MVRTAVKGVLMSPVAVAARVLVAMAVMARLSIKWREAVSRAP